MEAAALSELGDAAGTLLGVGEGRNPIHALDLLAAAALNRAVSLLRAFCMLLRERNYETAAAVVRLQLDTALRLYAGTLVEDADAFAERVIQGERVSDIKGRDGKRLSDRRLVCNLSEELGLPWVTNLYDRTCGWVHFSRAHILATVKDLGEEGAFELRVGGTSTHVPQKRQLEAIDACRRSTGLVVHVVRSWISQRDAASSDMVSTFGDSVRVN